MPKAKLINLRQFDDLGYHTYIHGLSYEELYYKAKASGYTNDQPVMERVFNQFRVQDSSVAYDMAVAEDEFRYRARIAREIRDLALDETDKNRRIKLTDGELFAVLSILDGLRKLHPKSSRDKRTIQSDVASGIIQDAFDQVALQGMGHITTIDIAQHAAKTSYHFDKRAEYKADAI